MSLSQSLFPVGPLITLSVLANRTNTTLVLSVQIQFTDKPRKIFGALHSIRRDAPHTLAQFVAARAARSICSGRFVASEDGLLDISFRQYATTFERLFNFSTHPFTDNSTYRISK